MIVGGFRLAEARAEFDAAMAADVAAMLDIYQLIGYEAMARAYRAIEPLRPPYGSPLSAQVIAAFVEQVSPAHRSQVTEKLRRVTF